MQIEQSWCNEAYQAMVNQFPHSDAEIVHEQAQQRLLEACKPENHFENQHAFVGYCLKFFAARVKAALKQRRASAFAPLAVDIADDREERDERTLQREYAALQIEESLAQLEARDRELLSAYHFDELSDGEIARRLYQIPGSVPEKDRRRVQRARQDAQRRLRHYLEQTDASCDMNVSV